MENGWVKTVLITALMFTIAFTGWTANAVFQMKDDYVKVEQYHKDMSRVLKGIDKLHDSVDTLKTLVYDFHTEK